MSFFEIEVQGALLRLRKRFQTLFIFLMPTIWMNCKIVWWVVNDSAEVIAQRIESQGRNCSLCVSMIMPLSTIRCPSPLNVSGVWSKQNTPCDRHWSLPRGCQNLQLLINYRNRHKQNDVKPPSMKLDKVPSKIFTVILKQTPTN